MFHMTIRECLALKNLFISLKMRGQNLMSRRNNVFYYGMVMKNLGTGYRIQ